MKAVMMSIQPKWCELIASGKKTVEVRKTKPKLETPFKVYIYATKPRHYFKISEHLAATDENLFLSNGTVKMSDGFEIWADGIKAEYLNGKVIGEFVCDRIDEYRYGVYDGEFCYHIPTVEGEKTCLEYDEAEEYGNGKPLYFWHITDLVIYDKPRELGEFIVPSKIGCCNEGKCRGCKYLDRGNGYNIEDDCNAKFSTDEFKPLRRPPQSWCYVEEVE